MIRINKRHRDLSVSRLNPGTTRTTRLHEATQGRAEGLRDRESGAAWVNSIAPMTAKTTTTTSPDVGLITVSWVYLTDDGAMLEREQVTTTSNQASSGDGSTGFP